jgi:sulfane dehydrogenase subunit SoxC
MHTAEPKAGIATSNEISQEELQLAARNHGMPLEGLRYDITPVGMHYLLTHFDIPEADAANWKVRVEGLVRSPLTLSMDDIMSRAAVTLPVTMECAGNGRARLHPRPLSQPWLQEAVSTAEWTGTPLAQILRDAGVDTTAREIVFTGADHGTQGGTEQDYRRSLPMGEAMRDDVLLAYSINGIPLPPQHGAPVRLLVPGWYGMTSVKWLLGISAVAEPFEGFQMDAYRLRAEPDDAGVPVTRMRPRALMIPPGFPDFYSRIRTVEAGPVELRGRAWSGRAPIVSVHVSSDGGGTWTPAVIGPEPPPNVWVGWSFMWEAMPGDHKLMARATDAQGETQPLDEPWNHHGLANNMPQQVSVVVRPTGR